jgi:hypothetical protein
MDTYFLDFETYYLPGSYSLKNLSTQEYIGDPRFAYLSMAIAKNDGPVQFVPGPLVQHVLHSIDWSKAAACAHNAIFDLGILGLREGLHPASCYDTLSMARYQVAPFTGGRANLETVAQAIGSHKEAFDLKPYAGRRWDDLTPSQKLALASYNIQDVEACRAIFRRLWPAFPPGELSLMDSVVRFFTQPALTLDVPLLRGRLQEIAQEKADALAAAGVADRSVLMSNDKLAAVLALHGVPLKQKVGPDGRSRPVMSKKDADFAALRLHPNPQVRALIEARLVVKSTIEETRIERLISIGSKHARLAVPLRCYGAATTRLSGADGLNLQNLPRTGVLRRALMAPPGYVCVVADASQIEARLLAWFAREQDLLQQFADKRDPYSEFATRLFNRPIVKGVDKAERQIGKVSILQLGYGSGAVTLRDALLSSSPSVDLSLYECQRVVDLYRHTFPRIKQTWYRLNSMIPFMAGKQWGGLQFRSVFIRSGHIELPNGMKLWYPRLRRDDAAQWLCTYGRENKKLYGGMLTENIIQALARVVLVDAWNALKAMGIRIVHSVHDELVAIAREPEAQATLDAMLAALRQPPTWAPNLPLDAEGGFAVRYGDAKS